MSRTEGNSLFRRLTEATTLLTYLLGLYGVFISSITSFYFLPFPLLYPL